MPADLFEYWRAYAGIHPFGHHDRILAHLAVRVLNATRTEEQDPIDIYDMLPYVRSEEEIMRDEQERMLNEMSKGK